MVEDNKPVKRGLLGGRRRKAKNAESTASEQPTLIDPESPAPESIDDSPQATESRSTETQEQPTDSPAEAQEATPVASALETPAAETPAPETAAVDAPAAETPAAETPAPETAAADAPVADAAVASQPAADEHAPAVAAPRIPPTTLLFQAPDLPTYVPPAREQSPRGSQQSATQQGPSQGQQPAPSDEESSGSSRRRNRRRSGEEPREGDEAPGSVTRVRQPRREPELITEPQKVKGSTRLEAKKQRRRDGRDAGRRRTVITEAEFLARRESVDRIMVVRSARNRIQIGVLEDGVLVEHYVARAQDASLIGNVYLGRVQNVLPSMEAAFVDIGRGRNAVLYSGEVDWDAVQADPEKKNQPRRIELALKPGDRVLVQVTKDPVGHKGARLTSQVSLPGRYLVYVPNGSMNGISRKLPDTERARLKKILKEVLPDDAGVIVRTAAEGATEEQLTVDVSRLTSQWAEIERAVEIGQAPAMLHSEPDLLIKIVRDVFNEDFHKLVVAGDDVHETLSTYLRGVAPDLLDRLESYDGEADAFDHYRISEQIEKALDRKVWLPSGGSLVIDRTEAMTVVDVNTGKFVGSGGNLEETVTKNNLEAAEEVVRQLRLRDIGGIIVVDFIDMVLESNRDLVLRRLVECLSRDRTKHQVAEVTSLGLVQMTRKKLGLGLLESFSENCDVCAGRGIIIHHDPVSKHRGNGGNGGGSSSSQGAEGGSSRSRRGRGGGSGSGGGSNGGAQAPASESASKNGSGTHAITEDVRNALAQIAKSTVPHAAESDAAPTSVEGTAPATPEAVEPAATQDDARQSGAEATTDAAPETTIEDVAEAAAEKAVDILDIPVAKAPRQSRRISTKDAELILDSVLEALPEPKKAGQGRGRGSRRASSSGAVVTPGSESESA